MMYINDETSIRRPLTSNGSSEANHKGTKEIKQLIVLIHFCFINIFEHPCLFIHHIQYFVLYSYLNVHQIDYKTNQSFNPQASAPAGHAEPAECARCAASTRRRRTRAP